MTCAAGKCPNPARRESLCAKHLARAGTPWGWILNIEDIHEGHKICRGCYKLLPRTREFFPWSKRSGATSRCKPCWNKKNREWRARNPEATAAANERRGLERRSGTLGYPDGKPNYGLIRRMAGDRCLLCGKQGYVVKWIEAAEEAMGNLVVMCANCRASRGWKNSVDWARGAFGPDAVRAVATFLEDTVREGAKAIE
jgi:hypothetical protein